MTVPAEIFRAYDIRGIVDETLTEETVYQVGQVLGTMALENKEQQIIVGRDGRTSGPRLVKALSEGIRASGCDVINIGQVATPVLYFACFHCDVPSAVMITGSHNPPNYNGLKMILGGQAIYGSTIQTIQRRIEKQEFASGEGQESQQQIVDEYIQEVTQRVKLARPMRLVVDCGNGVAGGIAPQLFQSLGCNIKPLFCEVDGAFPNHHPDPGDPENLQDLVHSIQNGEGEIGFAFDGDGDRLGVVNSKGEIIWPDRLLILFAKEILSRKPGSTIIYDVKSSRHVAEQVQQAGGQPIMWKTGHSLIKAKMRETGALLAGEMSGHIFIKDNWFGFDDALYAGARLLEILSQSNQNNSEIFGELPDSCNTPEIPIEVSESEKFDIMQKLIDQGEFADAMDVATIDGLRIEYADGWGLIRPSNTSPKLITRFEADTPQALARIQQAIKHQLQGVAPQLTIPF